MAITESRSLPPQFVEDLGKDYATQLTGLTALPLDTKKFQPMVAGQDAAQTNAYNLATEQGKGIGAFAPYLQQAGAFQQGTGSFAGSPTNMMGAQDYLQSAQAQSGIAGTQSAAQGALSGPTAYQQFMSPYQQDVIDASMSEFDRQSAKGMSGIGQLAAQSGNLGGGREGVMRSEYQSNSDRDRALLNAQLQQQGFGQAQGQANTAFGQQGQLFNNQQNVFNNQQQLFNDEQQLFNNQSQLMQGANTLGADQQRMASLVPGLYGQDVQSLQGAGQNQQLQAQNVLDQQREANRLAAYEPYERLGYMGAGMGNVMGGAMGQYQSQISPNKSALETALGIASLGYGMTK